MALLASAQQTPGGLVSGRVVGPDGQGLGQATVLLLRAADSTLVKGSLADAKGDFLFETVSEGRYVVAATQVGFQKTYTPPMTLNAQNPAVRLASLQLPAAVGQLAEVTVSARKPFIEQQLDKTIVNVQNSAVAAGNTALEVLERSPGVSVDRDGNVALKGKAQVRVMIDGKPTYMGSQDLANYLRGLQADQIEKIELMTQPSARYDAAGNAGIINIVTRKNQQWGTNGSATLAYGQGRYGKVNGSLNLNHRHGRYNVFGNYAGAYRKMWRQQDFTRTFRENEQVTAVFDQVAPAINRVQNHNLKLGADHFVTKKTTIGLLGTFNQGSWSNDGDNVTRIYNGTRLLQKTTTTVQDFQTSWQQLTANANLRHVLSNEGHELTADLDYARYRNLSDQRYGISTSWPDGSPLAGPRLDVGRTKGLIHIYSGKVDYVRPFSKTTRLEAGLKASYVNSDNTMAFTVRENNETRPDTGRTNHFIYTENIMAAYATFSKKIKKTSLQLGLRAEQTLMRGNQVTSDSVFRRHYLNLFPTVYLQHALDKDNTLGFSYSYRIDRPNYEDLNPFLFFLDLYTYQQGNPYLQPQFSNNLELSHTYKGTFTTTLNYSRTNGIITDVLRQNDLTRVTFINKENFGFRENYGVAVSASLPLGRKVMSTNFLNVSNNRYAGQTAGQPFDQSLVAISFNTQNQITLGKGWVGEVSGFYLNGMLEGVIRGRSMGQLSLGLQKGLLKQKASLKFNLRDVFFTQQFRGHARYANIDMALASRWESRVATLAFSYRFGNTKVQAARSRRSSLEEEAGRVKQGGN